MDDVAFSSTERDRHLGIRPVSQLNTWPVSPCERFTSALADAAHHSGRGGWLDLPVGLSPPILCQLLAHSVRAIVVGLVAGGFTLVLGSTLSPRRALLLSALSLGCYSRSAALAGYDVTLALLTSVFLGLVAESFAMLGAIAVGSTAWARVSILTEPAPGGGALAQLSRIG